MLAQAEETRRRIEALGREQGWSLHDEHLTDEAIVRRMVLKRCVYGVDKNPMAVELAKVALWLHTLTAGAPLSFLDHHLRCGDSLFGEWVRPAMDALSARAGLFINKTVRDAMAGAAAMAKVEASTDADLAEAEASRHSFEEVEARTAVLRGLLDTWQALKWIELDPGAGRKDERPERSALDAALDGAFGDPIAVLGGALPPQRPAGVTEEALSLFEAEGGEQLALKVARVGSARDFALFERLLARARALARGGALPALGGGLSGRVGGLDGRRARGRLRRGDRQPAVGPHEDAGGGMVRGARAADRAAAAGGGPEAAGRRTGKGGRPAVPRLRARGGPRGDRDGAGAPVGRLSAALARRHQLYSLFVERAQGLLAPHGIAGLLVPSGIASDLTASAFFRSVATAGRVLCLFDFENRRGEGRSGGLLFSRMWTADSSSAPSLSGARRGGSARRRNAPSFCRDPPRRARGGASLPPHGGRLRSSQSQYRDRTHFPHTTRRRNHDGDLSQAACACRSVKRRADRNMAREVSTNVRYGQR